MKRLSFAFLMGGITLLGGCAKTTLVTMAPDNSDEYAKAKVVFVILKTGEVCELKNVAIRGDTLAGTRIFRDAGDSKQYEQKMAVTLDDVSMVQVEKTTWRSSVFIGVGIGIILATATAAAIIALGAIGLAQAM